MNRAARNDFGAAAGGAQPAPAYDGIEEMGATLDREALAAQFGAALAHDLLACMSAGALRPPLLALGLTSSDTSDEAILATYFASSRAKLFSPNVLFDELWYRDFYPDVSTVVAAGRIESGFIHFVNAGFREGRWPNSLLHAMAEGSDYVGPEWLSIDEDRYLANNSQARLFLAHFPIVTALQHYNLYGRFLGFAASGLNGTRGDPETRVTHLDILAAEFDPQNYRARYMTGVEPDHLRDDPFLHYVMHGARAGFSPNDWFDEHWYRSFYPDIRKAIDRGTIPNGFYHYVIGGRAEGRIPSFEPRAALEARMPGVTNPVLLDRLKNIEQRKRPIPARVVDRKDRTIWFLFPTINPDLTFGGYSAGFELLRAIRKAGHAASIVCTEDANANKDYFLYREQSHSLRQVFRDTPIFNAAQGDVIDVAEQDLFVAYSTWDLWIAGQLASLARARTPYLLAQEFEPIFYDHGSTRAVVEEAYLQPHYPIVNSHFLLSFFKTHGIGVFGRPGAREIHDYAVFDHRIGLLPSQDAAEMAARSHRILAVYARPEAHASRNLFEIIVMALREICMKGLLGREWLILGVGALTEQPPIQLGRGQELKIVPRMSEADYHRYFRSLDIGISLMLAPHPSVMPFEFATTGALVVTNTFENRSADDLRAICGNIVPCSPTVAGVVGAIEEAIGRVSDVEARVRQRYRPPQASWDQIFSETFIGQLLDRRPAGSPEEELGSKPPASDHF